MIHDLHIVVADLLNGEVEAIYAGTDSLKANGFFDKAGPEVEAVRLFSYPAATRLRYPAKEAEEAKDRQALMEANSNTALTAKRVELALAQAKAELHGLRLAKLDGELAVLEGRPANASVPVNSQSADDRKQSTANSQAEPPAPKPLTAAQKKAAAKVAAKGAK